MPAPKWEERWPGRLEYELQALRDAGIEFARDDEAWERGILKLNVVVPVDGRKIHARATFPDYYPEFRVRVDAEPLGLSHHQDPIGGNLCLLGRASGQWQPTMTLAWLLGEPLRNVLTAGDVQTGDTTRGLEDPQAEPFSAYYTYPDGSMVLLDGSWVIPAEVAGGTIVLGLPAGLESLPTLSLAAGERPIPVIRCAVLEIRDLSGLSLLTASSAIREQFPSTFEGRWVRRAEPLVEPNPLPAFIEVEGTLPKPLITRWDALPADGGKLWVLGILFPEEVGHRETGEGWVFGVVYDRPASGKPKKGKRNRARPQRVERYAYYARPAYAGEDDLFLRIPSLRPMRSKTVALFGLGTLGAPAALEFARAGVGELRILDGDQAEPGPSVRWPFGLPSVGIGKVDMLEAFIRANYPYTRVRSWRRQLGVPSETGPTDHEVLATMIGGASLVFDATAEHDVQRLLARLAKERGLPYVSVVGMHGGWGGIVFRHLPGVSRGCWQCLQWAVQDGGRIPYPPSDDVNGIQPKGCGDPTFTGTSFDMSTIALDGVRKALGTLCSTEGGYPDGDWDVAVISLRNSDGTACPPRWDVHQLAPHPSCACGGT